MNESSDHACSLLLNTTLNNKGKNSLKWIEDKQFVVGENIGKGSFGMVYQCMNEVGKLYAIKYVNINKEKRSSIDDLVNEIKLMRGLDHPNIVKYIGASVDETVGTLSIIQEWVSGGSVAGLLKRYGPFKESIVKNYTRQILNGLAYLHTHGIVHRDIKPGNILIDESGAVKLADFGASVQLDLEDTEALMDVKGTPYFMAPEVLAQSRYGRKGDIWAVGCTMFQMLTGDVPWRDRNLQNIVQLHFLLASWSGGPPPINVSYELTNDIKECLHQCFCMDYSSRPTAKELLQLPFFKSSPLDSEIESVVDSTAVDTFVGNDHTDNIDPLSQLRHQMIRAMQTLNADDRSFEYRIQSGRLPPSPTTTAASAFSDHDEHESESIFGTSYVCKSPKHERNRGSAPSSPILTSTSTSPVRLSPLRVDTVESPCSDVRGRGALAKIPRKLVVVVPIAEEDDTDSCHPSLKSKHVLSHKTVLSTPTYVRNTQHGMHKRSANLVTLRACQIPSSINSRSPYSLPQLTPPRAHNLTSVTGRNSAPLARTKSMSSTSTGSDRDSTTHSNTSASTSSRESDSTVPDKRSCNGVCKVSPKSTSSGLLLPQKISPHGVYPNKKKGNIRSVSADSNINTTWRASSTCSAPVPLWPLPLSPTQNTSNSRGTVMLQPLRSPRGYRHIESLI